MRLRHDESRLLIQEKVTNIDDESFEFVWDIILFLGGNFLEDGCFWIFPPTVFNT